MATRHVRWLAAAWAGLVAAGLSPHGQAAGKLRGVEVLTSATPADLAPFYEKTFGWTRAEGGEKPGARDAVTLLRGGRPVASIVYHEADTVALRRARWTPFFARAEGAEGEAGEVVAKAGGKMLAEEHAGVAGGGAGQKLVTDAEGAVSGLTEGVAGEGPGGLWPVLVTQRPDLAAGFYGKLLGWEPKAEKRTPLFPGDFLFFGEGEARAGTAVQSPAGGGRAGWLILVGVADIEATTKAAAKAGGRVLREPALDLIGGRVAVIADPRGGVFGLYELVPMKRGGGAASGEKFVVEGLSK